MQTSRCYLFNETDNADTLAITVVVRSCPRAFLYPLLSSLYNVLYDEGKLNLKFTNTKVRT